MFSLRTGALVIAGCSFLLRLFYGARIDLLPEETYYWNYAQHLDIGYLDHPPLVAWLIHLGTWVFGDTELGVRSGALACGLATAYFVHRLTRNVCGERAAWAALVLVQLLPFFFMAGMLMTPDAPLTACWAATLYFLERACVAGRAAAWPWAGLSLGLGLMSKYTIVLLAAAALLFVLKDAGARRWLRRPEPYLALLIALLVFAPVIVWNAHHEWGSFAFQTSRRLADRPQFALHKLLGSALVLITPTGCVALLLAWRGAARGERGPARIFLMSAVAVPLGVFLLFSLRHEVKLDWTGAPLTAALPLLAHAWADGTRRSRLAWRTTLAILALVYAAGLTHLAVGLPGVGYGSKNELLPAGWHDLGEQVARTAHQVRTAGAPAPLLVGMDRYAIASELQFYAREGGTLQPGVGSANLFGGMGLMYELWAPAAAVRGRTLLMVSWDARDLSPAALRGHFERLEPLESGLVTRNGRAVRRFYYRLGHDYSP